MVHHRAFVLLIAVFMGCHGCDDRADPLVQHSDAGIDATVQLGDAEDQPDAAVDAESIDMAVDAALEPCEVVVPEAATRRPGKHEDGLWLTVTGRALTPEGENRGLEGFPGKVALHPSGQWVYVSSSGRDERKLYVVDVATMEIVQDLDRGDSFDGLAMTADGTVLYASAGDQGGVDIFRVGDDGQVTEEGHIASEGYPAGLALNADETTLWVAVFNTGTLIEIDLGTRELRREIRLDSVAWDVSYVARTDRVYVSHLGSDLVSVVDGTSGELVMELNLPTAPAGLKVSPDESTVWVAVAGGDAIASIDVNTNEVTAFAPAGTPGPDGEYLANSNVNALAHDPQRGRLYASLGSENAVAVFNADDLSFLGSIPTSEYPTDVALSPDGAWLLVSEGLGYTAPNEGRGAKEIVAGSVSRLDLENLDLAASTAQVRANMLRPQLVFPFECDGFFPVPTRPDRRSPIEHVVLLVKENKTFDCVFGDLEGMDVDVDPSLVRYGEEVTPNQHALAREFAISDNFYAEVEDSDVGHVLLTSAHLTEFVRRVWIEKDRSDNIGEGYQISESAVPQDGNFFTHLMDHDIDLAIYGEVVGLFINSRRGLGMPILHSDPGFPGGGYVNYSVTDEEKARYFAGQVADGRLAEFSYVLFPNDHTVGTRRGYPTPESMVADNDRAVGIVVEAIANSPFWEKSAIIIVQDDPQGCSDHVDAHRSFVMVVSPWARRRYVSHVQASFASVHATIERILGIPPMGQTDGTASPLWDMFTATPSEAPYRALERRIPPRMNGADAPGSEWSARMDFRGPDRNPGLSVILDAYMLFQRGEITREEAQHRIDNPRMSLEKWLELIEESHEERFAFDADYKRYQTWLRANPGWETSRAADRP